MSIYLWDKARLPSEYQEVEYIESGGTQYINTGYVVNTNTSRIYTKFEPQNVSTSQGSSTYQNPLFGTRTSDYNYETCLWASPSNQTYSVGLSLNGYTQSQATPADSFPKYPLGTIIELDYGKTGGTYNSFTFTWNAQYQGVTPNLLIFGIWSQGSVDARKFFGKLYSFKIYEGDNEVRNFVPCYRKSDNVIGLYDLVNNQFYTNSGTGTFSKGADVLGEKEVKNIYIGGREFTPSTDTIFYLKNDGDIVDYSPYQHTMNWYGTSAFYTLPSGRKVADFGGSNMVYSDAFTESRNYTTFTQNVWMKNKNNTPLQLTGWIGRNSSSTSTTDRWGAIVYMIEASTQYVGWGATNAQWQYLNTLGILPDTSNFYLYSYTIDGKTEKLYKNGVLVGSRTGTYNIIGGSTSSPVHFYLGAGYSYYGGAGDFSSVYMGENILERRIWSADEILDYYNRMKKYYQ